MPAADDAGTVRLVDSAFVQAMREGWVVMIDEVNTIRDVALLSINACLDGRLILYLPATGETVIASPGFACLLAYNPGLVGGAPPTSPTPGTRGSPRHSRSPATGRRSPSSAPRASSWPRRWRSTASGSPARTGCPGHPSSATSRRCARMIERVGERAALAFFVSNLLEQVQAGKIQDAEAAAVCRMLDQAGYAHLKVSATGRVPNLHGYPRAVTS